MTNDRTPMLGGQDRDPRTGNEPEMSGARPTCDRCALPMMPAPVKLYIDGQQTTPAALGAWHCACRLGEILLIGGDEMPSGAFHISYTYEPNTVVKSFISQLGEEWT